MIGRDPSQVRHRDRGADGEGWIDRINRTHRVGAAAGRRGVDPAGADRAHGGVASDYAVDAPGQCRAAWRIGRKPLRLQQRQCGVAW